MNLMRHIKDGVKCDGLQVLCLNAMLISAGVFRDAGQRFTITSISDGVHSKNSLHYKGLAFDVRTRDLKGKTPAQMAELLRAALGPDYDVVVEATHIHVEYDPK